MSETNYDKAKRMILESFRFKISEISEGYGEELSSSLFAATPSFSCDMVFYNPENFSEYELKVPMSNLWDSEINGNSITVKDKNGRTLLIECFKLIPSNQ